MIMSNIMSHKIWMKETYGGVTARRSSKLKAIDTALLNYEKNSNPVALKAINAVLQIWIASKGNNWKTSVRNKHNAVDTLFKQVTSQGTGQPHNPLQLSRIRDESRAIITDLFQGTQLVFRPGLVTKLAGNGTLSKLGAKYTIGSAARNSNIVSNDEIVKGIKSLPGRVKGTSDASGSSSILSAALLRESVPAEVRSDVMFAMSSIMPDFLVQLNASCAPFVGVATSGGTTLLAAVKVTRSQYRLHYAQVHASRSLSTGEPEAAFKALIRMLDREDTDQKAGLAIGMAELSSKAVSVLVDGGTVANAAIGLASGLMKLLMLLRVVVRDITERNAANKLLLKPLITIELFNACPVLGAYLICCAPTSVIVNTVLSSDKFYQPGMMDTVQRAVKKHVEPLKEQAQRLVKEHRMFIPSLQNYPGVLEQNKKELKRMLNNVGKGDMVGFGSDDFDSITPTRARR
jgi:hypothetical protein